MSISSKRLREAGLIPREYVLRGLPHSSAPAQSGARTNPRTAYRFSVFAEPDNRGSRRYPVILCIEERNLEGWPMHPEQAEWIEQLVEAQTVNLERIWHAVWRFRDEESVRRLSEMLSEPGSRAHGPKDTSGERPTSPNETPYRLERLPGPDLLTRGPLFEELVTLLGRSWNDPRAVLSSNLGATELAYVAFDAEGGARGLFTITRHTLPGPEGPSPAIHLGLATADVAHQGTGLMKQVVCRFYADARGWEQALGEPYLLWGTTATPVGFLFLTRSLARPEPRPDGSHGEAGRAWALAIRRHLGVAAPTPAEHPFVLHALKPGARFSEAEVKRLAAVAATHRFTLFEELDILESRGDRLLFIGRVPPDDVDSP